MLHNTFESSLAKREMIYNMYGIRFIFHDNTCVLGFFFRIVLEFSLVASVLNRKLWRDVEGIVVKYARNTQEEELVFVYYAKESELIPRAILKECWNIVGFHLQ